MEIALKPISLDELLAVVGTEVGVSPWRVVSQTMIDQFADATDDHQFIHVDPERAARRRRSAAPSRMASCRCRCCRR